MLSFAQISGKVTDTNGEALAFANVYVQGTTIGTTTNDAGDYFFELKPGTYQVAFQYVGYQQKILEVTLGAKPQKLDVKLVSEAIDLLEVVVLANAEDPAYRVIREAIAKRNYYRKLVASYQCDVYIKGTQKILDAPEKIFGQEIGNMGGNLDTNRQGIVYLSESEAKLYYKRPNQVKEEMISSKVSGNDNGFSFNRATLMDFNFYENFIEIERNIISPIANNALSYYRYKLIGTLYDEDGYLINKIEVIPKRSEDPVFRGYIYIVEDLWNIQSTELILTGAAIKQPILDSLIIRQVHVPVRKPDVWMQLSQALDFRFGLLGFEMAGNFTGVFSNYELDVELEDKFFNNEIFKVNEGANDKELTYWDSIRPVPLTIEESSDYVKKDSLQKIWESKEYLDSIDAKNNRFKVWDLLFGYNYNNSFKKRYFSVGSPLTTIQFNPVQGWYGNIDIRYRHFFDEFSNRWFSLNPVIQYGLSDKRWRGEMSATYNFSNVTYSRLSISGGRSTRQLNSTNPISPTISTLYSLWGKKNYIKLYEKDFARLRYQREIWNGVYVRGSVEYAQRRGLENTTNYSFRRKSRTYEPNFPFFLPEPPSLGIDPHEALTVRISMRLRWAQKYMSYPGQKFIMGSRFPDLWVHYRKGIKAFDGDTDYDLLKVEIRDNWQLGLVGRTEINLQAGSFLNQNRVEYPDYQYFRGNQTFIGKPDNYLTSYHLLPYYEYSTNDDFAAFHLQHHFEGFLLDKIPLLRKLGLKTVLGASWLYVKDQPHYNEISFGLDNLGFGVFRLFRVDAVASFRDGKYDQFGVILGVNL